MTRPAPQSADEVAPPESIDLDDVRAALDVTDDGVLDVEGLARALEVPAQFVLGLVLEAVADETGVKLRRNGRGRIVDFRRRPRA